MDMLEVHSQAIEDTNPAYHEFLSRYSKTALVVYGFVEGREDPSFYRGFIESKLPEPWQAELWAAGNKDQVIAIHSFIDWRRFPKERICFFIDRDFADLLPVRGTHDRNIYITDNYSIENSIVSLYRIPFLGHKGEVHAAASWAA